ncbi:MAG: CYTH domain-containing protein [Elusimicrobia bacterium]|nr:CYTH domain-containing protein [Elusimicrobiota bacterium]
MQIEGICRRLRIDDPRFIEIETKRRIAEKDLKDVKEFLLGRKRVKHVKAATFFDQFLDTPSLELLKRGASLRVRYKNNGSNVYLQYKGPGYHHQGILYRSQFSSGKLDHLPKPSAADGMVRLIRITLPGILKTGIPLAMKWAMRRHLGRGVVGRISRGPILCVYHKDKFEVKLGEAFLEPSIDRVHAFHVNGAGLHALASFCEYENEVKAKDDDLEVKLDHLDKLLDFDRTVIRRFRLRAEHMDKYHRCASGYSRRG